MSDGVIGAAEPPLGSVPNFSSPTDVYQTISVISLSIFLALVTLFYFIRVYVKMVIKRREFFLEDWFCGAAWILTVLFGACFLRLTHYGGGYHVWEISAADFEGYLLWLYLGTIIYIPAVFATKVVLLLMIARVFSVRKRVSWAIRMLCVLFAVAYIPIQCVKIAVCNPISAYWKLTSQVAVNGQNPFCVDQSRLFITDMIVAVLADLIILIIPIPLALTMRLPGRFQLQIIFTLSVGGTALGAVSYKAFKTIKNIPSEDLTVDFALLATLSVAEPVIGVICACLPSTNILLESLLSRPPPSRNVPQTLSFFKRLRIHIGNLTASSLSIDIWSKFSPHTQSTKATTTTTRTQTGTRTQNGTRTDTREMHILGHNDDVERCELGLNIKTSKRANITVTEERRAGGKRVQETIISIQGHDTMDVTDRECDSRENYPMKRAKSWDGVVRVQKSEDERLRELVNSGPPESKQDWTSVRIKWLSSASR